MPGAHAESRSVADQLLERDASTLPQTSANKSLPLYDEDGGFVTASGLSADWEAGAAQNGESMPRSGGWRLWGGLAVLIVVVCAAVCVYIRAGARFLPRSMRMARRRSSAGRRSGRHSV